MIRCSREGLVNIKAIRDIKMYIFRPETSVEGNAPKSS
jgi:hypothetical protein